MYSRRSANGERTFGVSGKLWHGVLVMFDRESDSLWTQVDGRSIQGAALGARLEHVPSVFTTWAEWRALHPDTLVLDKSEEARQQTESHYAKYFDDPERLFLPHLSEGLGGVAAKQLVFGVTVEGESIAVTQDLLQSTRVVNAVVGGVPIAWLHDEETGFPIVVDRRLNAQRVLVAEPMPEMSPALQFTDVLSGEVHGPDELEGLRVDRAYWYAWKRSHPHSRVLAD